MVRPIAMTSPVAFICVPSRRTALGELVKREARHLGDDVVERRLKAGVACWRSDDDLIQRHAHGDLRATRVQSDSRSPCWRRAEERDTRGLTSMT